MKTLVSCAYNMDNCCVELKFTDGSMIAIDTIAVAVSYTHLDVYKRQVLMLMLGVVTIAYFRVLSKRVHYQ